MQHPKLDKSFIPESIRDEKLTEMINSPIIERKIIAEGLLYEKTCIMFSSEPGIGKSTLSIQVAVELASGLPVFGYFDVPEPIKVLYIQAERDIIETIERLKVINVNMKIPVNNLAITDQYQKLDLMNPRHAELFIECIKRDCPNAKVIFIDPIYATVKGGLKEDVGASHFTRVMSRLQKELGCTIWLNHHTVKQTHEIVEGKKFKKHDPYYGSQWLKAHVTGAYWVEQSKDGTIFKNTKDNYSLLQKIIALEYNPETELSYVIEKNTPSIDKLKRFLKIKLLSKETFVFSDLESNLKLCKRTCRELLMHSCKKGWINEKKSIGKKTIFTVVSLDN